MADASVLFCDEIRKEVSGKLIILGVYTGGMVVRAFPMSQRISALVTFKSAPPGELTFRFASDEGAIFGQISVELEVEPGATGPFYIPLPVLSVTLSEEAIVQLELSQADGPFEKIGELSVSLADGELPGIFENTTLAI